jgi:hypothetical protein
MTVAGAPVARAVPGLLTYFSFKDGALTWEYELRSGTVAPFKIGNTKSQVWGIVERCHCFDVYPPGLSPTTNFDRFSTAQRSDLVHSDSAMISRQQLGSPVLYQLKFDHGVLVSVHISSSAFESL